MKRVNIYAGWYKVAAVLRPGMMVAMPGHAAAGI